MLIRPAEAPPVQFGENYSTAQIYSQGFEFAFMSNIEGVYNQACTFVYCKDFLHDAVWAFVNKTAWSVFQFNYDFAKDLPLDMNNCVFAFRNTMYKNKEDEFHGQLESCQQFLAGIEAKLGFQPSQIYKVDHDDSPCWLVIGDKGWQHAPPLVGLYTLLIRLGFMHKLGESADATLELAKEGKITIGDNSNYAGNKDCTYIKQSWPGIQVLFEHGLAVFNEKMEDNYPADLPKLGRSLHDHFGPVSFSEKLSKKAMPSWYKEEHWGPEEVPKEESESE